MELFLFDFPGYAEKMCMSDGTWYRRGEKGTSVEKTNYSPCSPVDTLKQKTNVHLFAYAVSTATLIPSLFVFYSYKYILFTYFLYTRIYFKFKRMFLNEFKITIHLLSFPDNSMFIGYDYIRICSFPFY